MLELGATLLASGVSCMVASGVLNPIDACKARMQINSSTVYVSLPTTMRTLWRRERVAGLCRGLTPSMCREVVNSVRIGTYDYFRRRFADHNGDTTALRRLAAGLCAGTCGSFAGNPFELIKVRFQTTVPGVDRPAAYTTTWATFFHIYRHEGGIFALYRGLPLTVLRAAFVTGTQMASYDTIKRLFPRDGMPTHVASALCAAFVTTTVTSPIDVIKTRYMNDSGIGGGDGSGKALYRRYASIWQCVALTWRDEGARAFARGWTASFSRLGPHFLISMPIMEAMRKLLGLEYL